jgi:hypothetical protein
MASLSGGPLIGGTDVYSAETVPTAMIGQLVWDGKTGKAFRYVLNGASALVVGDLVQASVRTAQHENLAIGTAAAVGDKYLQVTNGTTTIVPADFIGGTISVYTAGTVTICDEYTIVDIDGTLTTGGALKVYTDKPIRYVYSTSATVNVKKSPWSGVIQAPITTATEMPVGVAIYPIPASTAAVPQYGWVLTHGVTAMLSSNQTAAVGSMLGTPCLDAAGAATVYAAATGKAPYAVARMGNATGCGISVFVRID